MKPKTIKIVYWSVTILFAAMMLMDGIAGLARVEEGKQAMEHLGYPVYVLSIFGIAKVLGAIAIVQTKFHALKEWAYAGFTINFIGASMSIIYAGDGISMIIPALVVLAFMFVSYFLWKKVQQLTYINSTAAAIAAQMRAQPL